MCARETVVDQVYDKRCFMSNEHTQTLSGWRDAIDTALRAVSVFDTPEKTGQAGAQRLQESCAYVLNGGGKRLRGLLACSTWSDVAGRPAAGACRAVSSAVALEVLHAASLVHDDLPALDNDDVRRGKPSCHKAFNEATAILTGDVLLGAALVNVCSDGALSTDEQARLVRIIATAWRDLCVGQQLDLTQDSAETNQRERQEMIRLKTGALFGAAVACGALCAGERNSRVQEFYRWGVRVGECFQALDDLDDGDRPASDREMIQRECSAVREAALHLAPSLAHGVTAQCVDMILPR